MPPAGFSGPFQILDAPLVNENGRKRPLMAGSWVAQGSTQLSALAGSPCSLGLGLFLKPPRFGLLLGKDPHSHIDRTQKPEWKLRLGHCCLAEEEGLPFHASGPRQAYPLPPTSVGPSEPRQVRQQEHTPLCPSWGCF